MFKQLQSNNGEDGKENIFSNSVQHSEARVWLNKRIQAFAEKRSVNNIDYDVAKRLKDEAKKGIVMLNIKDIRNFHKELEENKNLSLTALASTLHGILECYYLAVHDTNKAQNIGAIELNLTQKTILSKYIIINIEKFTDWLYEILNKFELKEKNYGYFNKKEAEAWLSKEANPYIDYILAFLLYHKMIFRVKDNVGKQLVDVYVAPNYLREEMTEAEEALFEEFEKPLVKYEFEEFFHANVMIEVMAKFYDYLISEKSEGEWRYQLWKNKVFLRKKKGHKPNKLFINFELPKQKGENPVLQISRFRNVSDFFSRK